MPPDDNLAPPESIPDPGRGKRIKNVVYTTKKGDVRKWNGRQFVHAGSVPKSKHVGVSWHTTNSKWIGQLLDTTAPRYASGTAKVLFTKYFADEDECFEAVTALRAQVDARTAETLHAMAQERDATRDLPPCPANAALAAPDTAYYGPAGKRAKGAETYEFRPVRYVRAGSTEKTFQFQACCQHGIGPKHACAQRAAPIVIGGEATFCTTHGGGLKVGEGAANRCSHCKSIALYQKRMLCNKGNGLCAGCEDHLKAEAAANGSDGPVKDQRWEDVVFEQLLPLITYADGTPFPPDQRDARNGGGLGTSSTKKRRRECDTTTNRFPDSLWVLRDDKSNRAVLVVLVEVDEDSHVGRDPQCESGKIDDTFQSLQDALAKEGAARGAVARHDAQMVPIVLLRINPNAYDGPKRTHLKDRVKAVAALANSYLHMDAVALATLQTNAPIVHVLYYHSKDGAKNLAHYAAKAAEAGWAYTVH